MNSDSRPLVALLALSLMLSACLGAEKPFVKIKSPTNGTVVHPGQSLTMIIDASPFSFWAVMGPRGTASFSGPPYRIDFSIESDLIPGRYPYGVLGVPYGRPLGVPADKNEDIVRDDIELDVELSDSPKSLKWELWNLYNVRESFHAVGETRWLSITGTFADGTEVELRLSKLTSYESSAPSVVTIDSEGKVTAIGPGSAKITVKNGEATTVVPVVVPSQR
jgi:hypothetical protein